MIKELQRLLVQIKWGEFLVTIIHKDKQMTDGEVLQEEHAELSAIFPTQYQIGDYFTGFECERPEGFAFIPAGSHWVPARQQGEYRLDWEAATTGLRCIQTCQRKNWPNADQECAKGIAPAGA